MIIIYITLSIIYSAIGIIFLSFFYSKKYSYIEPGEAWAVILSWPLVIPIYFVVSIAEKIRDKNTNRN